jgi:hypothetical protein
VNTFRANPTIFSIDSPAGVLYKINFSWQWAMHFMMFVGACCFFCICVEHLLKVATEEKHLSVMYMTEFFQHQLLAAVYRKSVTDYELMVYAEMLAEKEEDELLLMEAVMLQPLYQQPVYHLGDPV